MSEHGDYVFIFAPACKHGSAYFVLVNAGGGKIDFLKSVFVFFIGLEFKFLNNLPVAYYGCPIANFLDQIKL